MQYILKRDGVTCMTFKRTERMKHRTTNFNDLVHIGNVIEIDVSDYSVPDNIATLMSNRHLLILSGHKEPPEYILNHDVLDLLGSTRPRVVEHCDDIIPNDEGTYIIPYGTDEVFMHRRNDITGIMGTADNVAIMESGVTGPVYVYNDITQLYIINTPVTRLIPIAIVSIERVVLKKLDHMIGDVNIQFHITILTVTNCYNITSITCNTSRQIIISGMESMTALTNISTCERISMTKCNSFNTLNSSYLILSCDGTDFSGTLNVSRRVQYIGISNNGHDIAFDRHGHTSPIVIAVDSPNEKRFLTNKYELVKNGNAFYTVLDTTGTSWPARQLVDINGQRVRRASLWDTYYRSQDIMFDVTTFTLPDNIDELLQDPEALIAYDEHLFNFLTGENIRT